MNPARFYYGWHVVAALFVMLTTASGLGFYNLSVYMNALVETQGLPVGQVSTAIAVFFISSGLAGLGAARMIQIRDPRWTIAFGGILGALALAALGQVTELWQLLLVYALFGAGHACAALVPATTLVARWFERRRAIALSVASTGLSIGGVVVTPASVSLITTVGLEVAAPWLALAWFLGIVPVTALVVRSAPDAAQGEAETSASRGDDAPGWSRADAIRSRFFVLVTVAWVLVMLAQVGGISHLFNLVATRSNAAVGATAVSLMASSSIVGRFIGGWLISRFDTRMFAFVCVVSQAGAMTALALAGSPALLLVAAAVFGATVGNLLMLQPLILAEAFGVRDYGRIFSLSQLLTTVGIAAGPALLGLLYDASGGYLVSFLVAAAASAGAFVTLLCMGPVPDPSGGVQRSPAAPAASA